MIEEESLFQGFEGPFEKWELDTFKRIDAELMRDIKELKSALTEFDAYRHVWAQIIANDVPPGRKSELKNRLEIMQGHALTQLDAAAWRLRIRIREGRAWRLIESAPKDGTHILGLNEKEEGVFPPTTIHWHQDGWFLSRCPVDEFNEFYPTHWQPITGLPKAEEDR